ncbi:hypothetical protein CIB48_g11839 [Xylaria polymorpha]|nr:hypothetical protein CIB48_g11839 [Xylaria polymorpha]
MVATSQRWRRVQLTENVKRSVSIANVLLLNDAADAQMQSFSGQVQAACSSTQERTLSKQRGHESLSVAVSQSKDPGEGLGSSRFGGRRVECSISRGLYRCTGVKWNTVDDDNASVRCIPASPVGVIAG